MADTTEENEAWLIKVGQVKDPKAPKPTPTKEEE